MLLAGLTSPEVTELLAYHGAEPFGEDRADLRAGIIASAVFNARRTRESDPVARPSQFMPFAKPEEPAREDPKRLSERLMSFFKGFKRARS